MLSMSLMAQTEYLPIRVVVEPMAEPFPATAQAQVENKLHQLLTKNGISSVDVDGQFFLTMLAVPQDKVVIPGPPTQIVETMELNCYIADAVNKIVFSSTSQTVKGVGQGETRAYMSAVNNMKLTSPEMARFIEEGKSKIIAYYDHEADRIIMEAQALSVAHKYEEAIYHIMAIPSQCQAYNRAVEAMVQIFRDYQDYTCQQNLALARAAWAAEQNSYGAAAAGEHLAKIYPDAACYGDAMNLYVEIKTKVLDDWKFQMKMYQDQVDLESQRIEAARAVGVAYGTHQPREHTEIGFIRGY